MVTFLKIFLSAVWLYIVYIVISTSLESNLFEEWNALGAIPWMRATLWDFYANVLIIFLFVVYKESKVFMMILWATLFFFLGSIATIAYVLLQLFQLKAGEPVSALFKRSHNEK